ncbi:MAG TPA: serine O-acetyltransferase [Firmicutes bacterium]|nr:serine O-acetyltransferase [Bacillota bacterium]
MFSDIKTVFERDPAAGNIIEVIFMYPGLHAIMNHRMAHLLWKMKIPVIPRMISAFSRFFTGVEIHPGAKIGKKFFIDHGMGVVVGETAIIGDNVLLYQGVTLGGTGKEKGKRHPTLENDIVVGAGAKVLGNITIGACTKIGAGSVVISDVPSHSTVVGIPGVVVKRKGENLPEEDLKHGDLPDPIKEAMDEMYKKIKDIESLCDKCKKEKK